MKLGALVFALFLGSFSATLLAPTAIRSSGGGLDLATAALPDSTFFSGVAPPLAVPGFEAPMFVDGNLTRHTEDRLSLDASYQFSLATKNRSSGLARAHFSEGGTSHHDET